MTLTYKKAPASVKTTGATTKAIKTNFKPKVGEKQDNSPIISAVEQYIKDGSAVVPLPNKSKAPTVKWGDNEFSKHDFISTSNVAIKCGDKSGGVIDIDCDSPEASYIANVLLPETGCVFGRSGNPNSHYLYKSSVAGLKTKQFKTESGECLIEFRANGSLTVVPPSVHPTGEPITFTKNTEISEVDSDTLFNAVGVIAALSLMMQFYPEKGSRHEYTLAISSIFARSNINQKDARFYLILVCEYAGDNEVQQRAENVKTTYNKFQSGEAITGHETLCEFFGDKNLTLINEWLGLVKSSKELLIEELNKNYAFVTISGKTAVIHEKPNNEFQLMKVSDFKNKTKNLPKVNKRYAADLWLESPNRREYDSIEFIPSDKHSDRIYNTYRGYSVEPSLGDCGLFLNHVRDNICSGNDEYYEWVMAWLADMFQKPLEKSGTSIALIGGQGTGKSLFANVIGSLIPDHFITVSQQKQLTGNFNFHMQEMILICAEEAYWAGSKAASGALKDLVTNDYVAIERKGFDVQKARNYSRFIFTTNEKWVAPAGEDERRFAVFQVSDKEKQNHQYFENMMNQMASGEGKAALLHHLLNYKYDSVLPRKIPLTVELFEQKLFSLEPVHKYWYDCLYAGELLCAAPDEINGLEWSSKIKCTELYNSFCKSHIDSKYVQDSEFGKQIRKCCPSIKRKRISTKYGQQFHYLLPPLDEARKEFNDFMNQEIPWAEECDILDEDTITDYL